MVRIFGQLNGSVVTEINYRTARLRRVSQFSNFFSI